MLQFQQPESVTFSVAPHQANLVILDPAFQGSPGIEAVLWIEENNQGEGRFSVNDLNFVAENSTAGEGAVLDAIAFLKPGLGHQLGFGYCGMR